MTSMIELMVDEGIDMLSDEKSIKNAAKSSFFLAKGMRTPILCLRFAGNDAVQQLNATWRDQDKVTDVLSFPMQESAAWDENESFGDIILAVPFVIAEAKRLELTPENHALHLVIHGCLHLLGYDHIQDNDADIMQQLEQQIMTGLGLHVPYPDLARLSAVKATT